MAVKTKILVVDDSPDFQTLIKAFVAEENYQVLSSTISYRHPYRPVDIGLPGGDSWMLPDQLKAHTHARHIPIVTGQAEPGLAEKATAKGATRFLNKPIDRPMLIDIFHGMLTGDSAASARPLLT